MKRTRIACWASFGTLATILGLSPLLPGFWVPIESREYSLGGREVTDDLCASAIKIANTVQSNVRYEVCDSQDQVGVLQANPVDDDQSLYFNYSGGLIHLVKTNVGRGSVQPQMQGSQLDHIEELKRYLSFQLQSLIPEGQDVGPVRFSEVELSEGRKGMKASVSYTSAGYGVLNRKEGAYVSYALDGDFLAAGSSEAIQIPKQTVKPVSKRQAVQLLQSARIGFDPARFEFGWSQDDRGAWKLSYQFMRQSERRELRGHNHFARPYVSVNAVTGEIENKLSRDFACYCLGY